MFATSYVCVKKTAEYDVVSATCYVMSSDSYEIVILVGHGFVISISMSMHINMLWWAQNNK